jgi:hypothetical protein
MQFPSVHVNRDPFTNVYTGPTRNELRLNATAIVFD